MQFKEGFETKDAVILSSAKGTRARPGPVTSRGEVPMAVALVVRWWWWWWLWW